MPKFSIRDWQRLGFTSREEMVRVISSLDLSTPGARDGFRTWKKSGSASQAAILRQVTKDRTIHYDTCGPTVVHFSGGRTSGLMLWMLLQTHGGSLPADVRVVFTNTGKERDETLDFVDRIGQDWNVDVHWVEYVPPAIVGDPPKNSTFRRVDHASAFRSAEPDTRPDGTRRPFDALIDSMAAYRRIHKDSDPTLPGIRFRICTSHLKIKTCARYVRQVFGWTEWESLVGLRADEPERVAGIRLAPLEGGSEPFTPLSDTGVTESEVMAFWRAQPFDLQLEQGEGNCDLCYLKSIPKLMRLMQKYPEKIDWWRRQEEKTGLTFHKNQSYDRILERSAATDAGELDRIDASGLFGPSIPCTCTD